MIYLDWAATAIPDGDLLERFSAVSRDCYGNPSSLHATGSRAGASLEESRRVCAELLGCRPEQLYFTSGGTESNNIVASSLWKRRDSGRVILSGLEHPSLWEPLQALKARDWTVKAVNPGAGGRFSPEKLARLITPDTKMIALMGVHNETGLLLPLDELIPLIREKEGGRPIHIHSDLVQAAGKIPFSLREWDLDSASFSAHKIGGPRGIGLLYLKKPLAPLYVGGGQEGGVRPGTENTAGAAALALGLQRAAGYDREAAAERMAFLTAGLEKISGCRLLPEGRRVAPERFSPWIVSCAFPPLPGEVLARVMNEAGFAISTGSACSSNKKTRTRALEAMGVDAKTAFSSIRVSQGPGTTREELACFLEALTEQVAAVGRAVGPAYPRQG